MSPSPAFSPVEPPSGRIICSLRAPELSATSSIDLIITAMIQSPVPLRLLHVHGRDFRHQRSAANNLFEAPAFQLGQRTSLFQANHVPGMSFVLFVVSVELLILGNHAEVEGV